MPKVSLARIMLLIVFAAIITHFGMMHIGSDIVQEVGTNIGNGIVTTHQIIYLGRWDLFPEPGNGGPDGSKIVGGMLGTLIVIVEFAICISFLTDWWNATKYKPSD